MQTGAEGELGALLLCVGKLHIRERGLVSAGWTGGTVIPWDRMRCVYYYGVRETIKLLVVPILTTESKTLTVVGDDGARVQVRGDDADLVYGQVVAATYERLLATAARQLGTGQAVAFDQWLLARDGITYPSRDWGKPRTVPWSQVKNLQLVNGEVELHEHGKKAQKRMFVADNFDLVIAKVSAVPNLQVFLRLGRDLAVALAGGPGKACPACGGRVRVHARFCRHCAHLIPARCYSPQVEAFVRVLDGLTPGTLGSGGGTPQLLRQLGTAGARRFAEFFGDAALPLTPDQLMSVFAPASADQIRRAADALNAETPSPSPPPSNAPQPPPRPPPQPRELDRAEQPASARQMEPRTLARKCGSRVEAETIYRNLARFKTSIQSAGLAALPDGVELRVTVKPVPEKTLRELRAAMGAS